MAAHLVPVYPLILQNEGSWTPAAEMYFTREFITRLIRMDRVTPDKYNRRDGFRLLRRDGETFMVYDDADYDPDEILGYNPKGRFVWRLDLQWCEHLGSAELVMKGRWPD